MAPLVVLWVARRKRGAAAGLKAGVEPTPMAEACDVSEEASAGEPPVAEVGEAIDELNAAIDNVNVLEDEAQACRARHVVLAAMLAAQARTLEIEAASHWSWGSAAAAAFDASRVTMHARRQQVVAEQALSALQAEQVRLEAELHAAQSVEMCAALRARLASRRQANAAATKALHAARKATSSAGAKEDKARRLLQRLHAQESGRLMQLAAAGAMVTVVLPPTLGEELLLLDRRLSLAMERDSAAAAEAVEVAEMERRKEAAAARVSDAMLALEEMSNEIHASRQQNAANAGVRAADDAPPPAGCGSSAESAGDSDFVCDDSASSDEAVSEDPRGRAPGPSPLHEQTPMRAQLEPPGNSGTGSISTARPALATPSSAGVSEDPMHATRTAVARLLRKATELVGASPVPTPSAARAPLPAWRAHRVDTVWCGVAWTDEGSLARLRGECSYAITQQI